MNSMNLGKALRLLRSRAGLSQEQVSEGRDAPTQSQISAWEGGEQQPSVTNLFAYLSVLGCDFGDLQWAMDACRTTESVDRAQSLLERIEQISATVAELERSSDLVANLMSSLSVLSAPEGKENSAVAARLLAFERDWRKKS